jgi:hypothetical protein
MTNRKIISDACTENSPLNVLLLGSHEHRHQTRCDEEENGRYQVLDADHLVVGVDAEVVLPRMRPVARVVFRPCGPAGGPVGPVVEAADADQEAERDDHHPRSQEDLELPEGGVVERRPRPDDEPRGETEGERRDPEHAEPAGPCEAVDAAARGRPLVRHAVGVLVNLDCHQLFPAVFTR